MFVQSKFRMYICITVCRPEDFKTVGGGVVLKNQGKVFVDFYYYVGCLIASCMSDLMFSLN